MGVCFPHVQIQIWLNILKHPPPSKVVLRHPRGVPVNACDALWNVLKVAFGSQDPSLEKAFSTASDDGSGAGSGRNMAPLPLHPSQIAEAS